MSAGGPAPASPSSAPVAAPPPRAPPSADLAGKSAWLPRADTRLGRHLALALRAAGCAVRGLRFAGEELEYVTESFLAEPELYNEAHERAKRRCMLDADVVVLTLPGDDPIARATLEALDAACASDGKPRAVIALSSPKVWASAPPAGDDPAFATLRPDAPLDDLLRWRGGGVGGRTSVGTARRVAAGMGTGTIADDTSRSLADDASRSFAYARAERLVLRASTPGALETRVARHGVLYGGGEFPDGFLRVFRDAWEGKPAPVFGSGANRIPTCHVRDLAACVAVLAQTALETARGAARVEPPARDRVATILDERRVTQLEMASKVAAAFGVPVARFPASRAYAEPLAASSADLSVGGEAGAFALASRGGADALLADVDPESARATLEPPDFDPDDDESSSALDPAAWAECRHRGALGEPVFAPEREEEEEEVKADPIEEEPNGGEGQKTDAEDAAEGATAEGAEGESAEPESPWEVAPAPVGGFPAVLAEFIAANGLPPKRVLVRGPPLADAEALAAETAEAYSLPLLVPAELVATWLPKCSEALREKCGDPTLAERTTNEGGGDEAAGDASADNAEAAEDPGTAEDPEADPEAEATEGSEDPKAAEARAREAARERRAKALELWDGLDAATRLELLRETLALGEVKRPGYVLAGDGVLAGAEACHELFTTVPPRPLLRLKRKPRRRAPGPDDEAPSNEDPEDPSNEEPEPEPEPEPEYPEETEEEAEARRVLHPDAAPTAIVHLRVSDGGVHFKKTFRDSDPEGYERYKQWAKDEEAAMDAHDEAVNAAKEAAKARKEAVLAAKKEGLEPPPEPAEGEEDPTVPPPPPETDEVTRWLLRDAARFARKDVREEGAEGEGREDSRGPVEARAPSLPARHWVDATGSAFARLRATKRHLGAAANFVGVVGDAAEDVDPAELAAAQAATARRRAAELSAAARRERAAALAERQRREMLAREEEALHARSASLRQYLGAEVMPTVTEAMIRMLKLRPPDPALALSEHLLRLDHAAATEEEAERVATKAMERAMLEEAKLREKREKLETSRRKAREARLAIKPKALVRPAPKPARPRPPRAPKPEAKAEDADEGAGEAAGEE